MKTLIIAVAVLVAVMPFLSYGIDSIMTDVLYDTDTFYEDLTSLANGNGFLLPHRIGSTYDPYSATVHRRVDVVQSVARSYIDSWRWGKGIQNDYDMTLYEFITLPIRAIIDFIIPKG